MSWNVRINRQSITGSDEEAKVIHVAPACLLSVGVGYQTQEVALDADNLRILIDALHCALDIIQPDLGVKQPTGCNPQTIWCPYPSGKVGDCHVLKDHYHDGEKMGKVTYPQEAK